MELMIMKPFVLLDLDGVILDSERPTYALWRKILPASKCQQLWEECLGLKADDEFRVFHRELGWDESRYQKFQQQTRLHEPPLFQPGALDLVSWLDENEYASAIVTSSSMKSVEHKIGTSLDMWAQGIDHIVTGDDVPLGKPAPDIYLKAMDLLDADPSNCVAVEDSANGVLSAHRADIKHIIMVEDTMAYPKGLVPDVSIGHFPLISLRDVIQKWTVI